MNTYSFRTLIEAQEDGTFSGFVPVLPGCQTWGWSSIKETQEKLREAIDLYLQSLINDGDPIPEDRGFESIAVVTMNLSHV